MRIKITQVMLALQPLFPIPIYFSILTGHPWWWLSWIIAVFPLGVRYFFTRRVISLTLFDVPILLFVCGILIGLIVAPDKGVAMGAVSSTFASILVCYGINCQQRSIEKILAVDRGYY